MMNSNQSVDSGASDNTGWATMGGTAGDGLPGGAAAAQQQPSPNIYQSPQQQSQQPQQMGSITRFATPGMHQQYTTTQQSSYAARSQQMYGSPAPGAGSSYVARSHQAYGPSPTQQQTVPSYGGTPQQQAPYATLPQQGYQQQSNAYGRPQQQEPYQQQQPNAFGGQAQAPIQSSNVSSFSARSQQAYSTFGSQQPSQGNVYGGASQASVGTYAARSAAALYGQQQTPSPPQQPPMPQQPQMQQQQSLYAPNQSMSGYPQQQVLPQPSPPPRGAPPVMGMESTQQQQRLLADATRKVQEHGYYMKQAMDQQNLSAVLDRAAHMVGELGGPPHGQQVANANTGGSALLTPKNYYELYMRALEDMPAFEDYLLNLTKSEQPPDNGMIRVVERMDQLSMSTKYAMRQLYDFVQYTPRVVSRLYLQIATGSALIRSGECGAYWVMNDLQNAVRCEQNPVRGLFLRNFLLTALRDKLPDTPPPPPPPPDEEAESKEEEDDDSAAGQNEQQSEQKVIDEHDKGTVKDSYEFILNNFMEMNKLWVRIQHLPGEGRNKDVRKRRERERNDLRILVGTNLVRLSQLECVTSKIYGEVILSQILDHLVTTGDPLSQAYLMDCLVQVFPDEYHIETLPILLNVCPRLRDKVNIRTILQGLMDRLANYLAEEELLDEDDTNQVKKELARDSFGLFEECVHKVYNARGPKLTSKEVIRLQMALLQFSISCYPGNMEQVGLCINSCVSALRQANASYEVTPDGTVANISVIKALDDASVVELEKFLSIPLDTLALRVLELEQYSVLIGFLPWANRREVAITMLNAVEKSGSTPSSVAEIEQLFSVIEPLVRDDPYGPRATYAYGMGTPPQPIPSFDPKKVEQENTLVAKLLHLLDHNHTDLAYEMLQVARKHIEKDGSGPHRMGQTLVALIYAGLRIARRVFDAEQRPNQETGGVDEVDTTEAAISENEGTPSGDEVESAVEGGEEEAVVAAGEAEEASTGGEPVAVGEEEPSGQVDQESKGDGLIDAKTEETERKSVTMVFVFVREIVAAIAKFDPERAVKLSLDVALAADNCVSTTADGNDDSNYGAISLEFLDQAYTVFEEQITESNSQNRCINAMTGTLLFLKALPAEQYERLITKSAQFAARVLKKPVQCQLVALCVRLFYPVDSFAEAKYTNAQRALECLQRALKLADACTTMNPGHVTLFVELLEHYVFFFEKKNPLITDAYISGLIALIREHLNNVGSLGSASEAKSHFAEVLRYITEKKADGETADLFGPVQLGD